jgi:hypothetical protein
MWNVNSTEYMCNLEKQPYFVVMRAHRNDCFECQVIKNMISPSHNLLMILINCNDLNVFLLLKLAQYINNVRICLPLEPVDCACGTCGLRIGTQ